MIRRLAALAAGGWLCLAGAAVAAPPTLNLHADVVPGAAPQEVVVLERDLAAGDTSGPHLHHGVEMTYVLRGDFELRVAGQPTRMLHAGDSFTIQRDTPHEARNVGAAPGAMIVIYLIDKGGPQKVPVPESALTPAK